MRSSWPSRVLLPAAQVVAEGSWLAVWYAAAQALTGRPVWLGPLELTVVAWAGIAWGRRRGWRSAAPEAVGLPLLALAAGAAGWLIDPEVRRQLLAGDAITALGLHAGGWIAAAAFWRGEAHRSSDDDEAIQDRMLRWGLPSLALPWVIGHLALDGALEQEFMAAAFMATVLFVGSAFTAMGLARLEAVRASTGSDWRANRSWVGVLLGTTVVLTLLAIPAAALLGIPARALLTVLLGPLQAAFVVLLLLMTPVVFLAAALVDAIAPLLPESIDLGRLRLPDLAVDARQITTRAPVILFYLAVAVLIVLEVVVVGFAMWTRWQERRRMRLPLADPFEERSIVVPPTETRPTVPPSATARRRAPATDPAAVYLHALDALERDGRWARSPGETPAAHADRARREGLGGPSLARMAAAYQLVRYAGRPMTPTEGGRAVQRLRSLRERLKRPAPVDPPLHRS